MTTTISDSSEEHGGYGKPRLHSRLPTSKEFSLNLIALKQSNTAVFYLYI